MTFGIILACLIGLFISQPVLKDGCVLDYSQNADMVKIRGVYRGASYPAYVNPEGCPSEQEYSVVLIPGDDPSLDEAFVEFQRLVSEEVESTDTWICLHCPRWEVTADFEGRLDIAQNVGFIRDPKTNKIIGREGFGGIVPFTRYRLTITGISNVEAVDSGIRPPISEDE